MSSASRFLFKPFLRSYTPACTKFLPASSIASFSVNSRRWRTSNVVVKEIENEETFLTEIQAPNFPVIVDFHAEWCGPCKLLGPKLIDAAMEDERINLLKVNIDNLPGIAQKYKIMSVPTVYAFYKGQPLKYFIGFQNTPGIKKFFEEVVNLAQLK